MKRLTINQIEKFIQTLESTERVNGYSEQQKQHAIACLNNYCRELEYQGRKSVKSKERSMDQRILNMTAGQVIEYSRLVSRREELRQFPEEEGAVAELKLIEERIKELGFE